MRPPAAPRAVAVPGTRTDDQALVRVPPAAAPHRVAGARPAVAPTGERTSEREAARRGVLRRRMTRVMVAGAALAAAAWAFFGSELLALDLDQVTLTGQGSVVDPAAARAVIEPHAGTPLPRLDTVGLRRELLDVPGVRAAEVTRVWPRGLQVTVVSREPVAAVQRPDGSFTLLDVEAVPVGRSELAPEGLPVVGVPRDDPGSRAALAVLTVLQRLPDDLLGEVASASAQSQDTVHLVLVDGAQVEWGSADETALKVRVLQALRNAEPSRAAAVFDVSAPTMPITRS